MFRVWRRMMKKPLARLLFGYMFGSAAVVVLMMFFAPIPMLWKQVIGFVVVSPYAIGIPLLELSLLIRERRLRWYLKMLRNTLPLFLIMTALNTLLAPKFFWQFLPFTIWMLFYSALGGSLARRLINLGYFGELSENKRQPS